MTIQQLPIGAVERDTGIPKDTLRVWERRYGFPVPGRNLQGERTYPADQVGVLRLLKQLVDRGLRPGKVVGRSETELLALLARTAPEPTPPSHADHDSVLDALHAQDLAALQGHLRALLLRHGLERFTLDHLAPLIRAVGEAWAAGRLAIHQEHLFSDQVERLLAQAIGQQPAHSGRAPVLLATLPGEQHRLGLRMVEALLTARGLRCISLGADVPVDEIATAAAGHRAGTVALSVSASHAGPATARAVADLRLALPGTTALWIGGLGARLLRAVPDGARLFDSLDDLTSALEAEPGETP